MNNVFWGDCLDILPTLEEHIVDAIITDLPYGTTKCKWDEIIPFESLWKECKRVLKTNGVFITTASQPFTSKLVLSNIEWFQDEWIWRKNRGSNFATLKRHPMKEHESVIVFSSGKYTYNPIMQERAKSTKDWGGKTKSYGTKSEHHTMGRIRRKVTKLRYPSTVQKFNTQTYPLHPTQKPEKLYEYIIKTYTNEGDLVLDIAMGVGTTGVVCERLNRNFIGIEKDKKYFDIAKERINK